MLSSTEIAAILAGELYGAGAATFAGCAVDSRQVGPGEIFVALPGEKTDGHRYIGAALAAGAAIVIAEKNKLGEAAIGSLGEKQALIAVQDSVKALQTLAGAWRRELKPLVVGITGSSGKTTTKDMIAAVLSQKYRVHKNSGNQNNELGLPLTILNARPGTEVLVVEMGMRGLGQVKALCEICRPDIGVLTNIGTTHMELLGSQEKIAAAKWELIESLPAAGIAVLNAEDRFSALKAPTSPVPQMFYGISGKYRQPEVVGAEIKAEGTMGTRFTVAWSGEEATVKIPLPGEHHVLDALAALTVGVNCKIPLAAGAAALANFQLTAMRLEILPGVAGSTLLSDVYNANPASMQASLHILAERGGEQTIAILGEMYELGAAAVSGHREVGRTVAELGISELITVGRLAGEIAAGAREAGMPAPQIRECADCAEAAAVARSKIGALGSPPWVLIKGSRGMRMERISERLREA
jgi:UDP-N-acetylmuramoyl-tripeptide--D-alanyl-D-alanine ligase